MMGLSTEVQLCGYYGLESLNKYMGAIVIFFLGSSIYIIVEHIYTRTTDKNMCLDSSASQRSGKAKREVERYMKITL